MVAIPPGYATPVWPPSGIALAAALLMGHRSWPGIALGAVLANVAVEASLHSAVLIACGNTLEALVGAMLIRRYAGDPARFQSAEEVIRFIALCAVSATIAATGALLPLSLGYELSWEEALRNWWTWWEGDVAGMILVTPLILSWSAAHALALPAQQRLEAAAFGLLLLASAVAISSEGASQIAPFSLTFLSLPFILWAALRFDQRAVTATIAVVCSVAIWYSVQRRGEFASLPLNELLLTLLAFISLVVTTGLVLVAIVGERSGESTELRRRTQFDSVTGLANAAVFGERLAQLLEVSGSGGQRVAVAVIDVERFKMVNDALGRRTGDDLLRQIAERLRQNSLPLSLLARISADRFALAAHGFENESAVAKLAELRLPQWFGTPYRVGNEAFRLSARMGIALFPDDATEPDVLYAHAESALKKAKATGESYLFYTQAMSERVAGKLSLENKLRLALEREEFILHYQPKVHVDTRDIVGLEALIRWNSPELGLVAPMEFIPLLEETGMILDVGRWALRQAVRDQQQWTAQGRRAPRVAVNVSSIQLRQRNFVELVQEAIGARDAASLIDLEITESRIMEDIDSNIDKLRRLRALGIRITIDDFGTGYSSLAYLTKLPIHTLKIDRLFIDKMLKDDESMAIVQTIISLAQSLKLITVAEGVESEEQADILELLRCDQIQGYLVSKALPTQQIAALLGPSSRS
jgi:diguanylate cyclase (GGDEF)-like protein